MLKYVFPRIVWADVRRKIIVAIIGGLIAGLYGVVHDHVTYAISPEYFTNLKFQQFDYADFGFGNRIFVYTIGFLATWWVGFIAAFALAAHLIPKQAGEVANRQIRRGFICIFAFTFACGLGAFFYGLWRGPHADYSSWSSTCRYLGVRDHWSFVRVAYIHNAGYLGAAIGLIVALVLIRPNRIGANGELTVGTDQTHARGSD